MHFADLKVEVQSGKNVSVTFKTSLFFPLMSFYNPWSDYSSCQKSLGYFLAAEHRSTGMHEEQSCLCLHKGIMFIRLKYHLSSSLFSNEASIAIN